MRQMSAPALCSRHECCWHTHQRREGQERRRGAGAKGEKRGEDGWNGKSERREGGGGGGKYERGEVDVESLPSEARRHAAQAPSAGRDMLRHVSVKHEPVWSESDTAS